MYLPFISLFKPGDPVRSVSNVQDHNRVANILNDVDGVGCHWEKPDNGEGRGWKVVVDGTTSDRYVAVDTGNNPGYLMSHFKDTAQRDTATVLVYRDTVQDTAPAQKVRLFIRDADIATRMGYWSNLAGTPAKVLAKDTAGTIGWASITLTAVDLAPQLQITNDTAGYYLQVRAKKVKLATSAGAIAVATDTYGDWAAVGACDT